MNKTNQLVQHQEGHISPGYQSPGRVVQSTEWREDG